jgi:hypothetical protein
MQNIPDLQRLPLRSNSGRIPDESPFLRSEDAPRRYPDSRESPGRFPMIVPVTGVKAQLAKIQTHFQFQEASS